MDGGVIQQFGTPDEIYERPDNLFVAGFIGAPAMNLRPARLTVDGRDIKATFETGAVLDLSAYGFLQKPETGASVIVGLRPEHFIVADTPPTDAAAHFELPLRHAERTGSDATAYLDFGDQLLALRVDPDRAAAFRAGQTVRADFPYGKANLFDARTGGRM
jgi:multiple sugar transport system ATP-binding protein